MHASTRLEAKLFIVALVFLAACFALAIYSANAFGIGLPTCVTGIQPFTEGKVIERAPRRYEIHYVARMWMFDPPKIIVPPDSYIDIYLSSADVNHGFHIAGTNVNLMAVPGAVNYARLKLSRKGTYQIVCHEYCGIAHHDMIGTIEVSDAVTQGTRISGETAGSVPNDPKATAAMKLLREKTCLVCHSTDGAPSIGPTFKGIFGRHEEMADGKAITVDRAYILESIQSPNQKVVKGFQPVMPPLPLTPTETEQIVEFLQTLK